MSPEADPRPPHEPQEVAIDPMVWASFSRYVGSCRQMDPQTLYLRSQINGDLRKPNGQPISELEATAIVESLQENGTLSREANEEGAYSVQSVTPEKKEVSHEKTAYDEIDEVRRRAGKIGRFVLGETGIRVVGENVHNTKYLSRYYGKELPSELASHLKAKMPSAKKAEEAKLSAKEKEKNELEDWISRRQTRLVLRSERTLTTEAQMDSGETVLAQFDPTTMREYEYLNSELDSAIQGEVADWKKSSGHRIMPKEELDALTLKLTDEIIREFYQSESLSDDEVSRKSQILTWFRTNKIGPRTNRRG